MDEVAMAWWPCTLGEALRAALLGVDTRGLDAHGTVIVNGLALESGQR